MKQLCKVHKFTILKSRINLILSIVFCFVLPFVFKIIFDVLSDRGYEITFDLYNMQIIVFLFVIVSTCVFYYSQQKSKIFLKEKENGYLLKEMFMSRLVVLELWLLTTLMIFQVIVGILCDSLSVSHLHYYFVLLLIYFKFILLVSFSTIILQDALVAAIVNWFLSAIIFVIFMVINGELEINTPSISSYHIISCILEDSLKWGDMAVWGVVTLVQVIILTVIMRFIYKRKEWK